MITPEKRRGKIRKKTETWRGQNEGNQTEKEEQKGRQRARSRKTANKDVSRRDPASQLECAWAMSG